MASPIDGKAEAVAVLKGSSNLGAQTKKHMSEDLINGVIAAERNEMSFDEMVWEGMGMEVGAGGLGPGQMYEAAHTDVVTMLPKELQAFIDAVNARLSSQGESKIALGSKWKANVKEPRLANFFILGSLALCVDRAQKPGRSDSDALRYGIVRYHGAFPVVTRIQQKVAPEKFTKNIPIPWSDVEQYINRSGNSKEKKLIKYIETVISGGITK